jgi:hypothetical protein
MTIHHANGVEEDEYPDEGTQRAAVAVKRCRSFRRKRPLSLAPIGPTE